MPHCKNGKAWCTALQTQGRPHVDNGAFKPVAHSGAVLRGLCCWARRSLKRHLLYGRLSLGILCLLLAELLQLHTASKPDFTDRLSMTELDLGCLQEGCSTNATIPNAMVSQCDVVTCRRCRFDCLCFHHIAR